MRGATMLSRMIALLFVVVVHWTLAARCGFDARTSSRVHTTTGNSCRPGAAMKVDK